MASVELDMVESPRAQSGEVSASQQALALAELFSGVRQYSVQICQPLAIEDYGLQAMASTSPAKWHLAHTSWFFETFLLKPYMPGYRVFDDHYEYLFNSYYNAVGSQFPRHQRGLLSRPTVEEIYAYRAHVDEAMLQLLAGTPLAAAEDVLNRTELGCHHEQQHQELFFTDLKYNWFQNPLYPAYNASPLPTAPTAAPLQWQTFPSGLHEFGHDDDNFCFDNELPRHKQYVERFSIADRLSTNGEYLAFIQDNGYHRPELWLADGWATRLERPDWTAPLYWVERDGGWLEYTMHGLVELDLHRPASHLSAYEADAFARWQGCRLPTEFEWELAAASAKQAAADETAHPVSVSPVGQLWQWTSSAYSPYPGFRTAEGAIGEYNGKFMANQLVLRGGSVATSPGHYRHSYRNFFYPPDQWQFTGVRLARESEPS